MSSTLPENTQSELKRDFARGVDGFRDGAAMPIGGLVLSKDTREAKFVIQCFSCSYFPQNITRAEAEERIATAKDEVAELFSLFPDLQTETRGLRLAFYFCHDDGKAAVCVARDEHGEFTYDGPKA
jgi:hypothetical protein